MKQIIKIVIIILIGSLLSGCVENTNQTKLVDIAGLQDDQLRESDNLEISWYNVFDDEHYWEVITLTDYPPFNNMIDDENHNLNLKIKHYYSIRQAHDAMNNKKEKMHLYPTNSTLINLTDSSYKIESHIKNPDEPATTSVVIIIHKNKCIGTIGIGGYSNINECNEVANYYGMIMDEMLATIQ